MKKNWRERVDTLETAMGSYYVEKQLLWAILSVLQEKGYWSMEEVNKYMTRLKDAIDESLPSK